MKDTKKKLDEAEFFLIKMKNNFEKNPDFDYYFSAFVSASRSVTLVMNKECKSKYEQYQSWKEYYIYSDKEEKILEMFKDWRNVTLKEKPLETETIYPLEFINLDDYEGDDLVFMKELMEYYQENELPEIKFLQDEIIIKIIYPSGIKEKVEKIIGRPYNISKFHVKLPKTTQILEWRSPIDFFTDIIGDAEEYLKILNKFVNYISQKIKS